ncbi:hypothetical protein SCMC78_65900 [Streptomyces sp. CMC78]|uniref:Uncharacterized protein n=1 Tax=Streptomyces sp. CMC78 TaxID=3231512 RepID=A0AB33KT34_9ACTN
MIDEDRGVGDGRVAVDVDDLPGGELAPARGQGRDDRVGEQIEPFRSGSGVLEGADGCAHGAHANSGRREGGRASQRTGGMATAMVNTAGSSPSLR